MERTLASVSTHRSPLKGQRLKIARGHPLGRHGPYLAWKKSTEKKFPRKVAGLVDAAVLAGALGMGCLYTEGARKHTTQALVVDGQLGWRASASLSSSCARRRQGQGQDVLGRLIMGKCLSASLHPPLASPCHPFLMTTVSEAAVDSL